MDNDVKDEPVNNYGLNLYNLPAKYITTAPQVERLFILNRSLDSTEYAEIDDSCLLALKAAGHASRHNAEKLMFWPCRLAHVGLKALDILPKVVGSALKMTGKCDGESWINCKFAQNPFTPNTTSCATETLQLVHSDIYGPLDTAIGGGQYKLLFIDDAMRYTDKYLLNFKSEALDKFKGWKHLREKKSGKQVKRFHTDGGGEYTFKKFTEYLKSMAILKEMTMPYTSQSNGVVELANCTILEGIWGMLDDAGLSIKYWPSADSVVVYCKNRTLMGSVVGKTPYLACHGRNPFLKPLHVIGCLAFHQFLKQKRNKLDFWDTPGIFVVYSISTKQSLVYDPLAKMLHHSWDLVFSEWKRYTAPYAADEAILNNHFYRDVIEEPKPTEKQSSERQTEESLDDELPPKSNTMKSRRLAGHETSLGAVWKPPAEGSHWNHAWKDTLIESTPLALEDEAFQDMIPISAAAAISKNLNHEDGMDDPKSFAAATKPLLVEKWDIVMKQEFYAIGQHQVFGDVVELLEGRKALPSHWVYKIKRNGARNVQRYKARLVCGGNYQIKGIDYQVRYLLAAHLEYVRLVLAIAAKYDLEIHQMDVCPAFLGVDLEEVIYMHPAQGYFPLVHNGSRDNDRRFTKTSWKIVLCLRKCLDGLRQSLHSWYGTFKDIVISTGFEASPVDGGLFVLHYKNQDTVVAAVIV